MTGISFDAQGVAEIFRYLVAGGLTTLLSLVIHYGMCFLLAKRPPCPEGGAKEKIHWVAHCVNLANARQLALASAISWIIAVLFAFWINKGMVFQASGSGNTLQELLQFLAGRVVSYLLFELGLAQLLKKLGISNLLGRMIVLVLVMVFNYVISKFWIF